ncbi:MAG: molecular chaperone HtpG [Bacteroidaceae bacterium]
MSKGTIGVTTENIFPVIKKFLYSDHEIFLREMVSNAVDATQKLKTFASIGEFQGEMGDITVEVKIDKEAKTLTISDRGIGLTMEELDKYINQIAFSGANDFLDKYEKDANAIIGHFGLGFYSSFMVSEKVEIISKSFRDDTKAVHWTCDGSPEFTMDEIEKADRGTDIILHIDKDNEEFLEKTRVETLLKKYCSFLAVPVAFGKKTDWKDGKEVETEELNIINDSEPLWTRKPSDLTDKDYIDFYKKVYPMSDDPLFWIHLNVDFPFHLTGILYFPKVKTNFDLQKNKIQLYSNQVYVTDSVEGIVPEFLTLLHGVIDSPDIPLNVSRSYLQSDSNVKKISTYITKKVSNRLQDIFKKERPEFESKWNDLKVFINYGMLTQEDFYEKAKDYALFIDTEGKKYTYDEYRTLIATEQTDKNDKVVYLYSTNVEDQYTYVEAATAKGYNVLVLDGQLDTALVGMLEQKIEKSSFVRVDGDTIDKLISKSDDAAEQLEKSKAEVLTQAFQGLMPKIEKCEFTVSTSSLSAEGTPIIITQSEYMRRMKEMANIQQGMSFYGEMPDMYNLVLNSDHKLVKGILADLESACGTELSELDKQIMDAQKVVSTLQDAQKKKKDEEIPQNEKDDLNQAEKNVTELQEKKREDINQAVSDNEVVKQLIDLALLQNGMLKGESLSNFIKRSVSLI